MSILPEFPTLKRSGGFARGRGWIQSQGMGALGMLRGSPLSTSEVLGWTHSHLPLRGARVRRQHRTDVRGACDQIATRIGRSSRGKGQPVLWRLKPEYEVDPYRRSENSA